VNQLVSYTINAAGAGAIFMIAGLVGRAAWERIKERR
jgi:hypothetical protein